MVEKPKEIKVVAVPQIDERALIKVGEAYLLTIHPSWLDQYALSEGDKVLVMLEMKEARLIVIPYSDKRRDSLLKKVNEDTVVERDIQSFGGSKGIYIPKDWITRLRLAPEDKLLALSNYGMSFEKYTSEKKKIFHERFKVWDEKALGEQE